MKVVNAPRRMFHSHLLPLNAFLRKYDGLRRQTATDGVASEVFITDTRAF